MKLTTQRGYDLYEVASALQKSIRRADTKLAGYMALELFPKYSEYCWKRLLTVSAEDCLPMITQEIMALYEAFKVINQGKKGDNLKGRIFISKAVIILCRVGHNRDADLLSNFIYDKKIGLTDEEIENLFENIRKETDIKMPEYVFDCHTRKGKIAGKTKEEFFITEQNALENNQLSIFDYVLETQGG